MRTNTKIITSPSKVKKAAQLWLKKAMSVEKKPNWNNERYAYIAKLISISLEKNNWLEDIEKVSLFYSKNDRSKKNMISMCKFIKVPLTHGEQCASHIFQNISLLLIHLSFEGHIELRFGHQIHLPSRPESFDWYHKHGLITESVAFVYMTSTEIRLDFFKKHLSKMHVEFFKKSGPQFRSTWQRAAMNLMEAIIYSKVSKVEDVTVNTLTRYYLANSEASAYFIEKNDKYNKVSTVTYAFYLDFFNQNKDKSFKKQYHKIVSSGGLSAKNVSKEPQNKTLKKIFHTETDIKSMTCFHLEHKKFEIETILREVNIFSVGDYSFSARDSFRDFTPENIEIDDYWKKTQLDYLNTSNEKGTRKSRQGRLAYLNSYLYDYLPTFFKKYPNCGYSYPKSPSEFLSFLFVKPSITLTMAHFENKKNVAYPVSLLNYIYTITDEKSALRGYTKTNAGRDTVATIQRYFEFIMARFSSIPECKIETNPITDFDKDSRKGYKYHHTVKEKISLDYWVLLRQFLYEVTKAVLDNAEAVVFNNARNKDVLKINKNIEWLGYKVHIDNFDATGLGMFSFSDWKSPIKITEYQSLVTLTLLAWSGLRYSNVAWLDVNNYSSECPPEYSKDDFVNLYVNTDKAKTEPYTSQIPGFIMKLLDRVAKLRLKIDRNGFNEAIPYQGAEYSKWSSIKPLLQKTMNNGNIFSSKGGFLISVLKEFEKCLNAHNLVASKSSRPQIEYSSSIYYLPIYANQATFRKIRNIIHAEQDYKAVLRRLDNQEEAEFTPIREAVKWTPHSLRVTFDSVCSVLADMESVGKISTGQGAATVGYYTINTPEETAVLKEIKTANSVKGQFPPQLSGAQVERPIASANDVKLNEGKFLEKHANKSAAHDFGCISLSPIKINGLDTPINTLNNAPANKLAFNRTHICPFDNDCPKEVLSELQGDKCCAICPYAIICKDHAIGISAELKRLGDIAAEINKSINSDNQLLKTEKATLMQERDRTIKAISGWNVRHSFLSKEINRQAFYAGQKNKKLIRHISGSTEGQNVINRLIETNGISSLTSPKLERQARALNHKIRALLNRSPDLFNNSEYSPENDIDVSLQLIKVICRTSNISEQMLSSVLENNDTKLIKPEWLELL